MPFRDVALGDTLVSTVRTRDPQEPPIGGIEGRVTVPAGKVLVTYAFNDFWKLSGRFEYVDSSGPLNILYGANSNAFSFTLTPTWQYKRFFIRPELSYVTAGSTTPGAALGQFGNNTDQFRGLVETGILF